MKRVIIIFIFVTIIFFNGCSSDVKLADENSDLKEKIEKLEKEISNLKSTISEMRLVEKDNSEDQAEYPLITYCSYESSYRFIPEEINILWFPLSGSEPVTTVPRNSLVHILDAGLSEKEGGELWLYIEAPVYDTPMNYKGWIREKDTVEFTEEIRTSVQSDVYVKEGTAIYEVYEFELISEAPAEILSSDARGRLEEKRNGYARVACAGGGGFWVEEKYINYPFPEKK